MQILKYLFYLLALTLVSVSIYILTLEKQFNIQDQFQVDVKEVYAQNYINDLKNWEEMIPTQQIDTLQNSSFYSNQITISLDSTYAKNSLFSIYLSGLPQAKAKSFHFTKAENGAFVILLTTW